MHRDLEDVTLWLNQLDLASAAADGEADPGARARASNQLFERLYAELHRVARSHMWKEDPGHTLSATALTHEAWFRMAEQSRTRWVSRAHFLAVASTMMRRILVNHAQAKRAAKREGVLVSLSLAENLPQTGQDVEAIHEALLAFEAMDPRAAKVVELKFFGGLENEEVAEALGISLATVKRDWALARAWLHRELGGGAAH